MTTTLTRESMTQVYHKDGGWVGFFMDPDSAQEWINSRVHPSHFYGEVGKPKRPKAKPVTDFYPSKAQAEAAAKEAAKSKRKKAS